MKRLRK
jgi:tRNA (guanine9-N1)-methyltransferase